ncbi:MAG: hypothetical protein IH594_17260 [Bacteroidales bacterium]|nr:hypothetical protein [Bacteroidales bacterium]
MTPKITCTFIFLLALVACKPRSNELNIPGYELDPGEIEITGEAMGDIIQNISSPIEIAALIKDLGVPFHQDHLLDPEIAGSYTTSFKMAYTLGMLGADLGYLNVYEKTGSSVNYLTAINRLADGLKVSQFFDFNTIKRLATSSSNLDSLVFLSVHSFNQMDDHLRETDRSNLSALMLAGVWIEGMYQATQVIKKQSNSELAEYIGEQKLILYDILLILENYEKDDQFAIIIDDYKKLKGVFDLVKITYEIGEPQAVEENDMLMIVQQEKSVVDISEETLMKIIETTAQVRNKHVLM